jgi:hypothetical protein
MPLPFGGGLRRPVDVSKALWIDLNQFGTAAHTGDATRHPAIAPLIAEIRAHLIEMQNTNGRLLAARNDWNTAHLSQEQHSAAATRVDSETDPSLVAGAAAAHDLAQPRAASIRSHALREAHRRDRAREQREQAAGHAQRAQLQVALASDELTEAEMVYATAQIPALLRRLELLNRIRTYWGLSALEPFSDDLARHLVLEAGQRISVA